MKNLSLEKWNNYLKNELELVKSTLGDLGYTLNEKQTHILGERHLQSGMKLVLEGKRTIDRTKVVIKISSKAKGKAEIEHEHKVRIAINKINFAYFVFPLPDEILYSEYDGFLISITNFIKESSPFLKHRTIEQFFLSLKALETQEGAHITTDSHIKKINKIFGIKKTINYLSESDIYCHDIFLKGGKIIDKNLINKASNFIKNNYKILDTYGDFLTHSDFVPHNLRIVNQDIYLLDHTSIHFGNKYEGWARFINYMVLYNKTLADYLIRYVKDNRDKEESLSLKIMRVYKLLFLINFHINCLESSEGNLLTLSKTRIIFWQAVLKATLDDKLVDNKLIDNYKKTRDSLRSESEIARQKTLNQL